MTLGELTSDRQTERQKNRYVDSLPEACVAGLLLHPEYRGASYTAGKLGAMQGAAVQWNVVQWRKCSVV